MNYLPDSKDMNYCFNCGTKLGLDDNFCPNCGTNLTETDDKPSSGDLRRGIIFTNTAALASKFEVSASKIRTIVERYIEHLARANVHYTLIDASSYKAEGSDRAVSLSPSDPWLKHAAVLADYLALGRERPRPTYLFIVGSGDIVPMPVVDHFVTTEGFPDRDIETDLPYCWLAGGKTETLLRSTELFKYAPVFHVGRLPLGTDSRPGDLENYFERAAALAMKGLRVKSAYGQSDINWRELSLRVTAGTAEPLFAKSARRLDSDYCYGGIYTTPKIEKSNVDEVFATDADIYYFNMHGSSAPSTPCFFGQYPDNGPFLRGISPEQIGRAGHDNIFVTEACYGGRFTGFAASGSMALSALSRRTALYLGSSRIAWGMTDDSLRRFPDAGLGSGDRMCHVFMKALCSGATGGEALYEARRSFVEDSGSLSPISLSSIVEFNLLGDPTLFSRWPDGGEKETPVAMEPLVAEKSRSGFYVEKIETGGLLATVRGMVDRNLAEIRRTLALYMSENFGLPSDALTGISKVNYLTGRQEYMFLYKQGDEQHFFVETDMKGVIRTILISK